MPALGERWRVAALHPSEEAIMSAPQHAARPLPRRDLDLCASLENVAVLVMCVSFAAVIASILLLLLAV